MWLLAWFASTFTATRAECTLVALLAVNNNEVQRECGSSSTGEGVAEEEEAAEEEAKRAKKAASEKEEASEEARGHTPVYVRQVALAAAEVKAAEEERRTQIFDSPSKLAQESVRLATVIVRTGVDSMQRLPRVRIFVRCLHLLST